MKKLRARLGFVSDSDAGISIIEAITALMIFSVIALGMTAALGTMTKLTRDDRGREVALGLAAQEISKVRAVGDAFDVNNDEGQSQSVDGVVYTIDRTTQWVNTDGSTATCGGSGGNLQFKRVNVRVTWPNMAILKGPVESDTLLAPANRINDPSFGTIIVKVIGADGTGQSGITATVKSVSTGTTLSGIDATDSDGCSYVLKVTPGDYTVSIAKSGYVDPAQSKTPTQTPISVAAGSTKPVSFQFDKAAIFQTKIAPGYAGSFKLPDVLKVNLLSTSPIAKIDGTMASATLFPAQGGYSAVAGDNYFVSGTSPTCLDNDPVYWDAGTVNGVDLAAGQRQPAALAPGASGPLPVPMGIVRVSTGSNTKLYAHTVAAPAGTGDPGCAAATTYAFSALTKNATYNLALPFGSWVIDPSPSGSGIDVTPLTSGEVTGKVVTVDPRVPAS